MSSLISELRTGRSNNLREFTSYKEILNDMEERVVKSASAPSSLAAREIWKEVHKAAIEIFKEIKNQMEAQERDISCNNVLKNFIVKTGVDCSMIRDMETQLLLKLDRFKELGKVKAGFEQLIGDIEHALEPVDVPD